MRHARCVLLVSRGGASDDREIERQRGWLSAAGIRAEVVGPGRSAARILLHVWRRLPDAGQLVLSRSVSPWLGAALVSLALLRGGRPHLYEVAGPPSESTWRRSCQRLLARTARVVMVPSTGLALTWGRVGASWDRLHVVPPVATFFPDSDGGRVGDPDGARALVVLTTNAHERSVVAAVGMTARVEVADRTPVPLVRSLMEADVVVTDTFTADLDPWSAMAAGRPVVLVRADASQDLAVAPFRELGLPVVAANELGVGIEHALRLDASVLLRHAHGYVSETAVAPHYVHAVASAAPS